MREFARRVRRWCARELLEVLERQTEELRRLSAIVYFQALPDKIVTFPYAGKVVKFYVPFGDFEYIQRDLVLYRTFPEESALRFTRETFGLRGARVVDIGANIGTHAIYYAAICGAANCIAFEPSGPVADICARNIELNKRTNVELRRQVVLDSVDVASFAGQNPLNMGGTTFALGGKDGLACTTIDEANLGQIDFLKIDVEGAEAAVLAGGADTLTAQKPPIAIEIFPDRMGDTLPSLTRLGYRQTHSLGPQDFIFEARR